MAKDINSNVDFETRRSGSNLCDDLLHAQKEREHGYKGHTADDVLIRMNEAVQKAVCEKK